MRGFDRKSLYGVDPMYISARERQILEILLSTKDELTVKDLADEIHVSVRTVHRDLKNVEDILAEYDLTLLKKSGVGIQVAGSEQKVNELQFFLFGLSHTEYTPEERQTILLCTLLEAKEPVKLASLANDLNVTVATVSNDLNKVEEYLQKFALSLLRKRSYGVEIQGSEGAKRRAMTNMISEHLNESEFLSIVRENIQRKSTQQIDSISERLLGLVEKKKLLIVEKAIEEANEDLAYSMADSAYIGLVVHLALAMERILQGENIAIDPSYLDELRAEPEYEVAEKIIRQLEKAFQVEIPVAEIGYITMHLRGAKLRHDKEYLIEDSSLQTAIHAKLLIQYVSDQLDQDLTNNGSLLQGLVVHLKPALYRIKHNMGISNPLLHKVKGDYPELFAIVKHAMRKTFHELIVPDEEIAYVVMHFGSVLLGNVRNSDIKALVICSSGIGTSKMLATKLRQAFPELQQVRNISLFELPQMDINEYPLIISTIPLPDFYGEYIIVSPILTKDEIEKIKPYITKHTQQKPSMKAAKSAFSNEKNRQQVLGGMHSIRDYAVIITTLLDGFFLKEVQPPYAMADILRQACTDLYENQVITDVTEVVQALLEREAIGGLGIPNTSLALFHARSSYVQLPSFTIYSLAEPIEVRAMDNSLIETEHVLILLSPEQASDKMLEALSYISSLLIESDESIVVFQSRNEEWIAEYLTVKFDNYFEEKIKEIRSV